MASSSSSASSVKYPYPVEVNPQFVSLSKQNYFVWKKEMLRLFKSHGLIGFINGKVLEPPKKITVPVTGDDDGSIDDGMKEIENKDYQDWKRSNTLLQRWIIGTTSEDVLPHLVGLKTAKDMWSNLITLRETKIVKQKLHHVIWKVTLIFVPQMKYIQEIKLKREQALELVKHLCSESLRLNNSKVREIIQESLVQAANSGIPEIVKEIIEVFPELVYHVNGMSQNIFHIAILNRCEDVFNLIYQFRKEVRNFILTDEDSNEKSCLDLVLDLTKEQKINLRASAAGAALQMQRELQWFEELEKHTIDYYKEFRDKEMTTSGTRYTKAHEELVKEGEKWMKDTAMSCTIIATLVATVVFAAVISVPGGNDDFGIPNLFQHTAFTVFIISDTIALFSSISSLLMFLAILTSRYSVTDFLFKLPNRLIIGLLFLFVSITSMMIAFAATVYLLFENNGAWILFPIIGLSCFPVTVFVRSQSLLLWDMMTSTYGPGIFGQQSDRILF